jgi:hypothetical protein
MSVSQLDQASSLFTHKQTNPHDDFSSALDAVHGQASGTDMSSQNGLFSIITRPFYRNSEASHQLARELGGILSDARLPPEQAPSDFSFTDIATPFILENQLVTPGLAFQNTRDANLRLLRSVKEKVEKGETSAKKATARAEMIIGNQEAAYQQFTNLIINQVPVQQETPVAPVRTVPTPVQPNRVVRSHKEQDFINTSSGDSRILAWLNNTTSTATNEVAPKSLSLGEKARVDLNKIIDDVIEKRITPEQARQKLNVLYKKVSVPYQDFGDIKERIIWAFKNHVGPKLSQGK